MAGQWRNRIVALEEHRPGEIADHPRQWRTHGDHQRAAIRGVLAEVGIADALLVYVSDGSLFPELEGQLTAIDGHLRKSLDQKADWPCLLLDLTDAEAVKLLATFDPLAAMAGADADALTELLAQVSTENAAVQKLLNDIAAEAGLGDEVAEDPGAQIDKGQALAEEYGTAVGQIWGCGVHRLAIGDCRDGALVQALVGKDKVGAVVTDPPYGIGLETDLSSIITDHKGWKGVGGKYPKIEGDDKPFDYQQFAGLDIAEQFWWGANYYHHTLPDGGSWLVWDKQENEAGGKVHDLVGSAFELCWSKQVHRHEIIRKLWRGLYGTETQDTRIRLHPAQKPVEVFEWIIERYTNKSDVVFDPFLGSGTTLIACQRLGRKCLGVELSPLYAAISLKRWEDLTGEKAVLLTGLSGQGNHQGNG